MAWLSDNLLQHLQELVQLPDLSATRYRLLEKHAQGGMGTIYLAEDTQLQRTVALKVLHVPDASGEWSARLLREARVIAQLEHPSIVPVHDVGTLPDGRVFYVMKFVQGQRLDQFARSASTLPNRLRIFQKVCEAVAFAHAGGVIHRDLKPENIMVGAFGEVQVMDWGLAKIVTAGESGKMPVGSKHQFGDAGRPVAPEGAHPTQHGTVLGTPAYMAPEQQRGEVDDIDQRTDVYALGAILRFLLYGPVPEAGNAHKPGARLLQSAGGGKIPKSLAAIVATAMAASKEQRYATALALAQDIERFLNGLSVSSYKESLFEIVWRWLRRYQFMVLLVLVYLLVRILLFFWLRP